MTLFLLACQGAAVKLDETSSGPDESTDSTGEADSAGGSGDTAEDSGVDTTDSGGSGGESGGETGGEESGGGDTGPDDTGEPTGVAYDGGTGPYEVSSVEDDVDGSDVVYYFPDDGAPWPVVVWSHGFARGPSNHAAAAARAASWGFLVAVPSLPSYTDHEANGRAIAEGFLPAARATFGSQVNDQAAFVGHSAGGLASLLAAASTEVDALVLLDGVDVYDLGIEAAPQVSEPVVHALGDASYCNSHGNGAAWTDAFAGDAWAFHVTDACHCDFESDTDWVCTLACGENDATRQDLIQAYAIAALIHATYGGADEWIAGSRASADESIGRISW